MGKFKEFLTESSQEVQLQESVKEDIISILSTMNDTEINDFGEFMYDEIFNMDEDEYVTADDFTLEEIIEVLGTLDSDDLDYIYYMLTDEDEDEIDLSPHTANNANISEAMARVMKAKNRNKKKRKKFQSTKAEFRRGKAARKKEARMDKVQRKKHYRQNKMRIKKYQASYKSAVKSGKHIKKIRV